MSSNNEISEIEKEIFLPKDASPEELRSIILSLLAEVRELSKHPVTGLLTGKQYRKRLRQLMEAAIEHPAGRMALLTGLSSSRWAKSKAFPHGVIMRLDVNGLSLANRGGNHNRGNQLLTCAAESLVWGLKQSGFEVRENRWDTDSEKTVVSHISGDEFAILIPDAQLGEQIDQLCTKILTDLRTKTILGFPIDPDISIGRVDPLGVLRGMYKFYKRYPKFKPKKHDRATLTQAIAFADRLADAYCDQVKVHSRLAMMSEILRKNYEQYHDLIGYLRKGAFNARDEVFERIAKCGNDPQERLDQVLEEAKKLAQEYHYQLSDQIRSDWSDSDFNILMDQFNIECIYGLDAPLWA